MRPVAFRSVRKRWAALIVTFVGNMIALNLHTFQQSRERGNVIGVIYLEFESGAFPGMGWSDFPVIILSWWADALLQLRSPTRREVLWRFMDGPQSVTLTKVTGVVPSGVMTLGQVESHLLEAAKRVVAYCDQHKMVSGDLEALRENVHWIEANRGLRQDEAGNSAPIELRPSVSCS